LVMIVSAWCCPKTSSATGSQAIELTRQKTSPLFCPQTHVFGSTGTEP
jgi:hypothetical protein